MAHRRDAYRQDDAPRLESRWLVGLAVGFVGVCLIAACVAGGYYLWTLSVPPASPGGPVVPTAPGGQAVTAGAATAPAAVEATAAEGVTPTATTPAAAATVTLVPAPATSVAVRLAEPPSVDAELGEWEGVPSTTSAFRVHRAAGWDGTEDVTAEWRLAWDAAHLYVAVDVADDVHVQTQTGNQTFRGDSVELQIDTEPAANAASVNVDTYQVILSPGDFAGLSPSAFRFRGTDGGRLVDAPGHSVRVAARQTAGGYRLEAAIPWRDLDVAPSAGMELGLALNANDNDSPGTAVQEVMMSSAPDRTLTNPRTWGMLQLE